MPKKTTESAVKVVKRLPATENGPAVHCKTKSGDEYIVSQCLEKGKFTLWRTIHGGFQKLNMAKSPLDLYEYIPWDD